MDDDSDSATLERELQELLEQEDEVLASTPGRRLEDARAMADGVIDCCSTSYDCCSRGSGVPLENSSRNDDKYHESTHILQMISSGMGDSGEWKRFHDINRESQDALAEMNATLGSLRQWQKQRKFNQTQPCLPPEEDSLERKYPLSTHSIISPDRTSTSNSTKFTNGTCGDGHDECLPEADLADRDNPLLMVWQEHQQRAQQSAERLQQCFYHILRPSDDVSTDITTTVVENQAPEACIVPVYDVLQGGRSKETSGADRVADLQRNVESLEIHHWIQKARVGACDQAEESARKACEEIWRGAGAVGELEGELESFTNELDLVLSRLDVSDDCEDENSLDDIEDLLRSEGGRVPAAD